MPGSCTIYANGLRDEDEGKLTTSSPPPISLPYLLLVLVNVDVLGVDHITLGFARRRRALSTG